MSYTQFLGLKPTITARRSLHIKNDEALEPFTVVLPNDWIQHWKDAAKKESRVKSKGPIPTVYVDEGHLECAVPPPITTTVLPIQDGSLEDEVITATIPAQEELVGGPDNPNPAQPYTVRESVGDDRRRQPNALESVAKTRIGTPKAEAAGRRRWCSARGGPHPS